MSARIVPSWDAFQILQRCRLPLLLQSLVKCRYRLLFRLLRRIKYRTRMRPAAIHKIAENVLLFMGKNSPLNHFGVLRVTSDSTPKSNHPHHRPEP